MFKLNRWGRFALCALATVGVSQTQAQNKDSPNPASRVAMQVEWVSSPRAVLNINGRSTTQQRAVTATPSAPTVALEPKLPADASQVWSLEQSDKCLSSALERWAQQAGWQLVWEVDRDFLIESNLHLEGEFLKAVGTVMQSLSQTDYPLQAKANSATLTLRISRYQDAGTQ